MLALLAALIAAPAFPASRACRDSAPAPRIRVQVSNFPTVVEHAKGLREINEMLPVKTPKHLLTQGRTIADYRLRYQTDFDGACADKDCASACAWIRAIAVDVTPVAVRVYIPREYRMGSCEYEQLMRHERGHDLLHRRRIGELARDMRAAAERIKPREHIDGPVRPAERDAAVERLKERMRSALQTVYEAHLARVKAENDRLDTPREYRRMGRRCRGWKRL